MLATHPYQSAADMPPETPDPGGRYAKHYLTHLPMVRAVMERHGDGAKRIWFTEFGWSSHGNSADEPPPTRGVSEQVQADYLVRTLTFVQERYPYVEVAFWYNDRNRTGGASQHVRNYGLLGSDLSPKPAYAAVKTYLGG